MTSNFLFIRCNKERVFMLGCIRVIPSIKRSKHLLEYEKRQHKKQLTAQHCGEDISWYLNFCFIANKQKTQKNSTTFDVVTFARVVRSMTSCPLSLPPCPRESSFCQFQGTPINVLCQPDRHRNYTGSLLGE